jgi:hypothetical protein
VIVDSARTEVLIGNKTVKAPEELGGRILAVDSATLSVVNSQRSALGLSPVPYDRAVNSSVINIFAERNPEVTGNWIIRTEFPAGFDDATDFIMTLEEGGEIAATYEGYLDRLPATARWEIHPARYPAAVSVTRKDSGSTWKVELS